MIRAATIIFPNGIYYNSSDNFPNKLAVEFRFSIDSVIFSNAVNCLSDTVSTSDTFSFIFFIASDISFITVSIDPIDL